APIPTEGSDDPDSCAPATVRISQITPALVERANPGSPAASGSFCRLQEGFGTYTVPSGATCACPCSPPHSLMVYIGTAGPKLRPPSRLRAQLASAVSCEQ